MTATSNKSHTHTIKDMTWTWPRNVSWCYLVCQFGEVLLCIADHVSHSEDGAVGVVDHVKFTFFDVTVSDGWEEVPSAHRQTYHLIIMPDLIISVIISIIISQITTVILSVVEGWEADAILNENGEILHFHHWRAERKGKGGEQREGKRWIDI